MRKLFRYVAFASLICPTIFFGGFSRANFFEDSFGPIQGTIQKITRDDVRQEFQNYLAWDTGVMSEISRLHFWESWIPNYDCQIIFSVDEKMNTITIFHFDEGSPEPYYLYSTSGQGVMAMNGPKDLSAYSWFFSNPEKFWHQIYIADYGNSRILCLNYFSHEGIISGYRGDDTVEYYAEYGVGNLVGPMAVDAPKFMGGQFFVGDYDQGTIFQFSDSGQIIRNFSANDFQMDELYPTDIAAVQGNGKVYLGVISGKKYSKTEASVVSIVEIDGQNIIPVFTHPIQGAMEIDCSGELGFLVLDDNKNLYQISLIGENIASYSLQTFDQGVDVIKGIAVNNSKIALGCDYDADSGIGIFEKIGGSVGVTVNSHIIFNKFDSVGFNVSIGKSGNYNCFVRKVDSIVYEDFWENESKNVGVYPIDWSCNDCPEAEYNIFVTDQQKGDTICQENFNFIHGPLVEITSPQGGEDFYDGESVLFRANIGFSSIAVIDSVVIYLGQWHDGLPLQRWKKKPGDQNERGEISFRFDLPSFVEECDCTHLYEMEVKAYYQLDNGVRYSSTYVDPNLVVHCSRTCDSRDPAPCVYPCYLASGEIWLPNDSNIYVLAKPGDDHISFYTNNTSVSVIPVYDLRGRMVANVYVGSDFSGIPYGSLSVSAEFLSSGVYFAKVGNNVSDICRFVVIR